MWAVNRHFRQYDALACRLKKGEQSMVSVFSLLMNDQFVLVGDREYPSVKRPVRRARQSNAIAWIVSTQQLFANNVRSFCLNVWSVSEPLASNGAGKSIVDQNDFTKCSVAFLAIDPIDRPIFLDRCCPILETLQPQGRFDEFVRDFFCSHKGNEKPLPYAVP
jgi:hypothetical protein